MTRNSLDTHPRSVVRPWRKDWVLATGALAGVAALVGPELRRLEPLAADLTSAEFFEDQDKDGLPDSQEGVLGTDLLAMDTDGDGYSDLEEVARQSDALDASDVPAETLVNVGLAARQEQDAVLISLAIYVRNSLLSGTKVQVGFSVEDGIYLLPAQVFLQNAKISAFPGKKEDDVVILVQTPYPESIFHSFERISFWSTVMPPGALGPEAVDTVDVFSHSESDVLMVFEAVEDSLPTGGIYHPIVPKGSVPASWSGGQVCFQASTPIGSSGAFVEHLIETAYCEEADSYCRPDCESLAGGTVKVLDPIALLGG